MFINGLLYHCQTMMAWSLMQFLSPLTHRCELTHCLQTDVINSSTLCLIMTISSQLSLAIPLWVGTVIPANDDVVQPGSKGRHGSFVVAGKNM